MKRLATFSALALATLVTLGACSSSKTPPKHDTSLSNALSPTAIKDAAKSAKASSLPKADFGTPDNAYLPVKSGNQLMFLYAAISGMPPDYDKMASAYSNRYRSTNDNFTKHDLLKALKPKLDQSIANAKGHRYITWINDSPSLGHYDFKSKSFPIGASIFNDGGYLYFFDNSGTNLAVTNGADFQQLNVKDEATARQIEQAVGHYQALRLRIFGFAQSTNDSSSPTVQAEVTKIQLIDRQGHVLATQWAPH